MDVRTYGAKGDGVADDTVALQAAINAGLAQDKPVFVPSGTYVVSDTLWGKVQGEGGCGGQFSKPLQVIGSTIGARPVLRLSETAADGFNIANPTDAQLKAVLHIWLDDTVGTDVPLYNPDHDRESCLYRAAIRGIDFDLGSGHPSAVGIRMAAAQHSFVQDVKISAHGAFAGIMGLPGRNSPNGNIEIVGGRFGIYSRSLGLGTVLTGVRLVGQTEAAFVGSIFRGVAITGLEIVSSSDSAPIRLVSGGSVFSGNLTITDARVELAPTTPALVDNSSGRFISVRNAYVKGGQTLVEGIPAADHLDTTSEGWTRVQDFAYTPAAINGVVAVNLVGGVRTNATIRHIGSVVEADVPRDLMTRHIWSATPSFEDPDCYIIHAPSGVDDTAMLQAAIDAHAKVYLGSGGYVVSAPLVLRADTILMGTPGYRSALVPSAALIAAYPSPHRGWIVDTTDQAGATTTLQDIDINGVESKTSGLGALRWRAGRGLVRSIRIYAKNRYYETHRHNLEIVGEGGGRFYGYIDGYANYENNNGSSPHHPEFRKVSISGTHNPLTFYGLNLERGGDFDNGMEQGAFCVIEDSRNVRVFGTKAETAGIVYRIVGSENVMLHSIHANNNNADHSWPMELIRVENSTHLDFRNLYWPGSSTRLLVGGTMAGDSASREEFVGAWLHGTFDEGGWSTTPTIVSGPADQTVKAGGEVTLRVEVDGTGPFEFQWLRDGVAVAGAVGSSFHVPCVQTYHAGSYAVSVANADGSITSVAVSLGVTVPPPSGSRLLNLSTRALCLSGNDVLIPGFVAAGEGSKQVLIRAVGPRLADLGVDDVLADPRLVLKRQVGTTWVDVGANDDWWGAGNADEVAAVAARVGAFSLLPGSRDAALLTAVSSGLYSVVADDSAGRSGVAIVEVYDAETTPGGLRLVNLSNRGFVDRGSGIMIPGFVVSAEGATRLLLRAIGPGLQPWMSSGWLPDPQLRLYRRLPGNPPVEQEILSNDNWGENGDVAEVMQAGTVSRAFALLSGSADAAVVVSLPPGVYTAHASGVGGATGIALVELYEIP